MTVGYEVRIDRLSVDLFDTQLWRFWYTLGYPTPLTIINKDGIETDGHVGLWFDNDDDDQLSRLAYRVRIVRVKYKIHLTLERNIGNNRFSAMGMIYAEHTLLDQVLLRYFAGTGDPPWGEKFTSFLMQMYGAVPHEIGENTAGSGLAFLLDTEIDLIVMGGESLKTRVKKIDELTRQRFGFRWPDIEIARRLGCAESTVHTYRRPGSE